MKFAIFYRLPKGQNYKINFIIRPDLLTRITKLEAMTKSLFFAAIIALALSACSTQKQSTAYVQDDVYNPGTNKPSAPRSKYTEPKTSGTQIVTSPDVSTAKTPASSSLADDYNDYSSRINRFNNKDTTVGYFDESLAGSTNSSGGSSPNVNIYLGAGMGFGGYYGGGFSFGMGWGYPYYGWGYDPFWSYPYYGWGYPYYGYGWGYPYYGWYNPWYNPCCYCYGYGYYEGYPYVTTGSYYGTRTPLYTSSGEPYNRNARSTTGEVKAVTTQNARTSQNPAYSRVSTGAENRTTAVQRSESAKDQRYHYNGGTTASRQSTYQRSASQGQAQTTRQQPSPKYIKPELGNQGSAARQQNVSGQRNTGTTQSYASPAYRQPKSSREYLAPRTQNTTSASRESGTVRSNPASSSGQSRQYATPTTTQRTYTVPTRNESSRFSSPSRTYPSSSSPSRSGSNNSYTTPSRSSGSYSVPSSGGSYSAPSNSGSYSAPSRSGGGGGGSAPSGGGSSGGGGGRRR